MADPHFEQILTGDVGPLNAAVTALVAHGMSAHAPIHIAGTPAVLLPQNATMRMFPHLRDAPVRIRTECAFTDVKSLLTYLEHHDIGLSAIFINAATGTMTAYLDYHDDGAGKQRPGWCEHVAKFALTEDPRWTLWKSADRKWMSQADFAEFIEDNAEDVVKPESARLLEIVNNFKATKSLAFKSAQNLTNGETKLTYDETIESAGGKAGRIELPEQFEIGIRLFDGLEAYKLKARFRYRIDDRAKQIVFSYQLIRPQMSERDAIMQVVDEVEESPFPTYRGAAKQI